MGFGFNLFFIFIGLPAIAIISLILLFANRRYLLYFWAFLIISFLSLSILGLIINFFTSKTVVDKSDYRGEYIIDRDFFKGEQADWQYNHYRFEVTDEDSIFFYETEKERILNIFKGTVSYPKFYKSTRLKINSLQPEHHVLSDNPTTYRDTWDFYLVFKSPKFYNMYFKKGQWEEIEE